jgi:phosphoribosylanthranilate isomerase
VSVQVKICGINDAAAFDAAVKAGVDWVGFVFYPPSPRYVTGETAAALSARVSGGPGRVGLFVDPTDGLMENVLRATQLDALQVYARPERLTELRARFGLPLWHALGIETEADLPATAGSAERLVLEAKPPAEATRPGGNAARFDWSVLRGWRAPAPWVLAGGLTPENIGLAILATGAKAVDVSSGVERSPGVKDPTLIRAFVASARAG